jgi:hypothetical protein
MPEAFGVDGEFRAIVTMTQEANTDSRRRLA